ncbi:SLBB domain-containing protein [Brevundimonas sp. Leaf168]|uniref:polysaccharide biosynthesis/export family protein n=1 Tax=Brevundimonas sp. Leaf168 TaxID=1736283 RepID=UPI0006FA9D65|nr:SLBB domain-containing protein [Brevundimonas sp. Leaf168]KQR56237.1 hypothetical protein ASF81_07185 [Brevundimonas sp. Leaf168]
MTFFKAIISASAALLLVSGAAQAQNAGAVEPAQIAVDARAPTGPERLVLEKGRGDRPPPLGSEMFGGAVLDKNSAIVDPNHVLRPGDQVRVTMWGLVNEAQDLAIDSQGNVVVAGVGPVRLEGVTAGRAPAVIEAAARKVYSDGVQVYAAAISASSTQVLVTGPVGRPGAYSGSSEDALIVYLQRAGGVDAERGSYRRVRIMRGGRTLETADLYEFLRSGILPGVSFRNGDAVVVEEQGPAVSVTGDVRAAYTFELLSEGETGAQLMRYARPRPGSTHAAVVGVRDRQPFSVYLPLEAFSTFMLRDGDQVQFTSDVRSTEVLVRVEGAHEGASVFTLPKGTTLGGLLQQVAVSPDADMSSMHLRRDSVRVAQKQLIEEGLDRLERSALLAPARSPAEASARAASATFLTQFVDRARSVEPLGILALNGRDPNSVRLESGDLVVIPRLSQVVTIAGEVQAPQSLLALNGGDVDQYVAAAGGFTRRADKRHVLVYRQDGQLRDGGRVEPGDRILVQAKPDSTLLPFIRDITQTLFQTAAIFLAFDN